MQPEEQRIAIAEACGWKNHATGPYPDWRDPDGCSHNTPTGLPAYLSSLDAMHEVEKFVEDIMHGRGDDYAYGDKLVEVTQNHRPISTTAAQRAEAFLRCLNLWRD